MLGDPRIRTTVLAITTLLGFVGGVRNVNTPRTQAPEVAAVLHHDAKPGDLVVYCPDQVGPAVHRLAPSRLREVVYPSFAAPDRVDWVDYHRHLAAANTVTFAQAALTRAGSHTLWYVLGPGYITHPGTCETLSNHFAAARKRVQRTAPDDTIFEKPYLQQFLPNP